jgi:hypothetical protein
MEYFVFARENTRKKREVEEGGHGASSLPAPLRKENLRMGLCLLPVNHEYQFGFERTTIQKRRSF